MHRWAPRTVWLFGKHLFKLHTGDDYCHISTPKLYWIDLQLQFVPMTMNAAITATTFIECKLNCTKIDCIFARCVRLSQVQFIEILFSLHHHNKDNCKQRFFMVCFVRFVKKFLLIEKKIQEKKRNMTETQSIPKCMQS